MKDTLIRKDFSFKFLGIVFFNKIIKSIIIISEMRNANPLKHRKRQKFTNKLRTTLDYSPPDRFTSYSTENSHQNWQYQYFPEGRIFEELT